MEQIKLWLSKYNALTHTFVAIWVFVAGAYASNSTFHAYVNNTVQHLPPWLGALVAGVVVPLIAFYRTGLSDTGKVMVANEAIAKREAGILKSKLAFTNGTAKLGAVMLCCILVMGTLVGCSGADVQKAVVLVNAELPAIEAAVNAAAAIVSAVDPVIAPLVGGSDAAVQLGLKQLQLLCQQYIANPDSTLFAKIASVVDSLVANGDAALLEAAHIKDIASQQKATAILASLDALIHIIDGYISAVQPTKVVQARAAARSVRLKQVAAYWSTQDKNAVGAAFNAPYTVVYNHALQEGM